MTTRSLTLPERHLSLALDDRRALTLPRRLQALTLPDRKVSGGASSTNLARFAILQGFCFGGSFNAKVFLLYGLIDDLYDSAPDSTLTLYRRKRALTLGG